MGLRFPDGSLPAPAGKLLRRWEQALVVVCGGIKKDNRHVLKQERV